MFKVTEFLNELVVAQDDIELQLANDGVELTELGCDDSWLARQEHYGVAGAMERQIEYLGGTLIPNSEKRLTQSGSDGVGGESYQFDSFTGSTNEDDAHINDEVDQNYRDQETRDFISTLEKRMRTAGIRMITRIIAHDKLSKLLMPEQLSYGGIKGKAAFNQKAREDAAVNQQLKEKYAKTA
jgi:hypothetical protein